MFIHCNKYIMIQMVKIMIKFVHKIVKHIMLFMVVIINVLQHAQHIFIIQYIVLVFVHQASIHKFHQIIIVYLIVHFIHTSKSKQMELIVYKYVIPI